MNWKLHLALGFIWQITFIIFLYRYLGWYQYENVALYIPMFFIFILSPLVPDIDYLHGKVSQLLLMLGTALGILGMVSYFVFHASILLLIIGFVSMASVVIAAFMFKHRGFTHSITFILLFSALLGYFTNHQLAILNAVGMYTHLIGDGLLLKFI